MVNLNQITNTIQNCKKVNMPEIKTLPNFLQSEIIPVYKKKKVDTPVSNFKKNQIIEIPEFCYSFLDENNFYLYGSTDIFHSILFIIDENFRLGGVNTEVKKEEFRQDLLKKLTITYQKHKEIYNTNNIKRTKLETYLKTINFDNNIDINYSIFQLICDIKNINIIILDTQKKIYEKFDSIIPANNNIILIHFEGYILPLLNIYGKLFCNDEIKTIVTYFKKKLILNKISSYKLYDLQLMANNNNISIVINGKKKNKQQLYDELLLFS